MENCQQRIEELAETFARTVRRFNQFRPVTLYGESIRWGDTTCYLVATLDKRLTWTPHIGWVSGRTTQRMGFQGPSWRGLNSQSGMDFCCTSSLFAPWWTRRAPSGSPLPAPMSGDYRCCNPSVFALSLAPLGTSVTGRFTSILVFRYSPTISELWLWASI
jgi:hypothetical protein